MQEDSSDQHNKNASLIDQSFHLMYIIVHTVATIAS